MRVLLLVDCYLPSVKSSAKLAHDLAAEISAQGHEMFVATPDSTLTRHRVIEERDGVTILRVRTGRIKDVHFVVRGLNEAQLSNSLWTAGRSFFRRHPCDLIIVFSPSIFFARLAQRLKQLWDCPTYLILRDIFPQWAIDAGVLPPRAPQTWYFRHKERQQYRVADRIGVQSPANLDYFDGHDLVRPDQLDVLYNWIRLDDTEPAPSDYRTEFGLTDKVVFFFGGNIGVAQDMDNLLRLADGLRDDPRGHLLFVGDGSEWSRIRALLDGGTLPNVSLLPSVSQDIYRSMLSEFDIGLISLDRRLKTQNFPGKMLGYMYFAKPMLASVNPGNDLAPLLRNHDAGLVSINGDEAGLLQHARQLLDDPGLRARLGSRGRKLLEQTFSADAAVRQIVTSITSAGSTRSQASTARGHS